MLAMTSNPDIKFSEGSPLYECYYLYRLKDHIPKRELSSVKLIKLADRFALICWGDRKNEELKKKYLSTYTFPFPVIMDLITNAPAKGYTVEHITTTSIELDIGLEKFIDEEDFEGLIRYLQNDELAQLALAFIDEEDLEELIEYLQNDELVQLAINEVVFRIRGKYVSIRPEGRICFENGYQDIEFKNIIDVLSKAIEKYAKDELRLS